MKLFQFSLCKIWFICFCILQPGQGYSTELSEAVKRAGSAQPSPSQPELFEAIKRSDTPAVNELIKEKGLDIEARNFYGDTALHRAAWFGYFDPALALISHGASVNAFNNKGNTPLHWAAGKGRRDIAFLLMINGANVNAVNHLDNTPLHLSAERGYIETATLLIERGADIHSVNKLGQRPLHLADLSGHTKIRDLIASAYRLHLTPEARQFLIGKKTCEAFFRNWSFYMQLTSKQ
ncbi:MAG: ankyrin repeat domain-containing protein [Oligoflexia bacterium]|nr:ankyrin repeat domain-containing protein [Oligoflexia bacterium]